MFVADSTTMKVVVDKYGTPKGWKQETPNGAESEIQTRIFKPEDVIHISLDKKTGYTFGTPYILPVLDDVRALRKLEELTVMLASKEAFPLYHYKVGTEQKPATLYQDGTSEVEAANSQVSSLPEQGFIVTSERHTIELVSKREAALDIVPFLQYFEQRVLAGLRLSNIDLGRGESSSKSSAGTMGKNMQDSAKDYQQVISDILSNTLLMYLLLEGNFDILPDNLAKFLFPMIDREELRAHQTHGLNLYLSDSITLDEFRKEYLTKKELSQEEKNSLYSKMQLENDIALEKAKPKPVAGASGSSSSSSSSSKSKSTRKKVSTTNQPKNQYKTSPTKPRVPKNDNLCDSIKKIILYNNQEDIDSEIKNNVHFYISDIKNTREELILDAIQEGWEEAQDLIENMDSDIDLEIEYLGNRAISRFYKNYIDKSYWATVNPTIELISRSLKEDIDGNNTSYKAIQYIEILRSNIKKLEIDQIETARRFGFVSCAKRVGYKAIEVINSNSDFSREIDISEIKYTKLFPQTGDTNILIKNVE
jgi:hypothetical protein